MPRSLILLLTLAIVGCRHAEQPAISMGMCSVPQGIPDSDVLLFGEMHGSIETPELISRISCALSKDSSVAIGLEIPTHDQPLIDAFLSSDGTKADLEKLTSSDFWNGRDGRSSTAMLHLIEDARKLKNQGRSLQIFAFDDQPGTKLERNIAIANGIHRFHAANPKTKIIALMGNIHSMQSEITASSGERIVPSGKLLSDLNPVSILVTYPEGTTWACMETCGIQKLIPRTPRVGPPGFKNEASLSGYKYSYLLPSITASPSGMCGILCKRGFVRSLASALQTGS